MRPVRVTKRPKKETQRQKPDSGKLAIRRDHPRRRIEMKSCVVGGLQVVVLSFEFHQNRLSGFGAVGGRNLPFPIDLPIGLYNSLYYRTSREYVLAFMDRLVYLVCHCLLASGISAASLAVAN